MTGGPPVATARSFARTTAAAPLVPPTARVQVPVAAPSFTVTAEIPAVAGPPARRRPAERGTDEWYEQHRRPAPYMVRLTVWLTFFVLLLLLGGLAIEHYHPTWLNFVRRVPHTAAEASTPPTSSTAPPGSSSPASVPPSGFREISHTAQGASYAVPDSSYSIVMVVAERVWTIVNIPATATTPKYAQIVSPAESPKAFPVSGSSSIEISASATSIKVESGGTILGTIDAPKLMYLYSFVPTGT